MSAATDHVEHSGHAEHTEHGSGVQSHGHEISDYYFIKVALVLAAVTALETSTYWWPDSMSSVATPALLIMMVIKFFMIVLIFMHLKFDSKIFSLMFYIGLGLAVSVYCVFLSTFQFFAR